MVGEIEVDGQGYDHDVMMLVNNIEIGGRGGRGGGRDRSGRPGAAGEIEVDGPRCDHDVMMHVVMMTEGHICH